MHCCAASCGGEIRSHQARQLFRSAPTRLFPIGTLTIRQAAGDDVSGIAEIHVRSWQAAYRGILPNELLDSLSVAEREESWRGLLGDTEHHWLNLVAQDDSGDLAGFCAVTTSGNSPEDDGTPAEVGALYVDPSRWREGAGRAMLTAALASLKEHGWRDVTLWVLPENHAALAFYDRLGFEIEEGVEKREERSGRPVIRLRADLLPPAESRRSL